MTEAKQVWLGQDLDGRPVGKRSLLGVCVSQYGGSLSSGAQSSDGDAVLLGQDQGII